MSYSENLYKIWEWGAKNIVDAPLPWGINLVQAIDPKYRFLKWRAKGGEAVIIDTYDALLEKNIILKVALPRITSKLSDNPAEFRKKKNIFIKNLKRLTPGRKRKIDKDTELSTRFDGGGVNQRTLHKHLIEGGFLKYGYIPDVYEIGRPPIQYVAMEQINGESLFNWAIGKTQEQILRMFLNIIIIFEGVLHAHGIVHADVKPDNFMVLKDIPVFLDFSVSKDMTRGQRLTTINSQISNRQTTSPEQKMGASTRDYRDDIFSIMVCLWIVWEHKEPVLWKPNEGNVTKALKIIQERYPSSVFPFPIKMVFDRATKAREERYQDISDMRKDFEEVINLMYSPRGGGGDMKRLEKRIFVLETQLKRVHKVLSEENDNEQGIPDVVDSDLGTSSST